MLNMVVLLFTVINDTQNSAIDLEIQMANVVNMPKSVDKFLTLLHLEWPKLCSFGHSECNRVKTVSSVRQ